MRAMMFEVVLGFLFAAGIALMIIGLFSFLPVPAVCK